MSNKETPVKIRRSASRTINKLLRKIKAPRRDYQHKYDTEEGFKERIQYLSTCASYLLFDLEATKRENKCLTRVLDRLQTKLKRYEENSRDIEDDADDTQYGGGSD